jgi:drug/metabolite transporter (DMT)-like permease
MPPSDRRGSTRGATRGGTTGSPRAGHGRTAAYPLLAAGMVAFGSGTPVSRLVTQDFPALLASALRVSLGAAVLVPAMLLVRHRRGCAHLVPRMSARDAILVGAIAAIGVLAFSVLMLRGMAEVTGAAGSVVMATTPAVTALGAVVAMRERPDAWRVLGILLAVLGVLLVNLFGDLSGASGGVVWLGIVLVFGAVCSEAAYTLLGKRLTADMTPLEVAALASAVAAVLFAPLAVWQGIGADWDHSSGDWVALAWWGFGTLALGSVLWYSGVMRVPGTVAAGFMGLMPVAALVISYVLLDESFQWAHVLGMGAVLLGIAAVTRSHAGQEGEG